MLIHTLLHRYMAPAGDAGGGGDAVLDRGDDYTPKDDPKDDPKAAVDDLKDDSKDDSKDDPKDDPKKKADKRIPLARHEEMLTKERDARKALEQRLAQYEKGDKVADINASITEAEKKLLSLEKEFTKLNADGEVDRAADKLGEIRKLDRQIVEAKNDMKIQAAVAQATEAARYNIAMERVEEAYPQLNEDSDDYDADLAGDVVGLMSSYRGQGMTPTAALQKAVKRLLPPVTKAQEAAAEVKPRPDAAAIAAERKKVAVEKALDAAKKSPPDTKHVGLDSDKAGGTISAKDVVKMSFKDFSALNEETLSRMRGDVL